MASPPSDVKKYLEGLPEDRRRALEAVRAEINRRLPPGYVEGIQYGMIGWVVPHSVYPAGYHCDPRLPVPFAGLASQKNYISLHLMCIYGDEGHRAWLAEEWKKTGKKLDMGKACIRFKKLEDLPLALVGEAVARVPVKEFLARYQAALGRGGERGATRRKAAPKGKPVPKSAPQAASKRPARRTVRAAAKRKTGRGPRGKAAR
jgi:hypothetical protein